MSPAEQLQRLLVDADKPKAPPATEPIRFSRLKKFSQSPAHYAGAAEPSASGIDVGSAAHSMLLGGVEVVEYTAGRRYGKAYDSFCQDHPDALILSSGEYRRAKGMSESVRRSPLAMRLLDGEREKTYTWKLQGRLCRGTPDVRGKTHITELKTGETADPRFLPFKVRRFCYHGQLAWYMDGAMLAGVGAIEEAYIVAVESAPPYVVQEFRIHPGTIEMGRRLVRLWFERLLQCEAVDQWPGYSQSVVELALPDFDMAASDEMEVAGTPEDAIT